MRVCHFGLSLMFSMLPPLFTTFLLTSFCSLRLLCSSLLVFLKSSIESLCHDQLLCGLFVLRCSKDPSYLYLHDSNQTSAFG
mmetsp:Transcript_11764/g.35880  ORF Transcript_11764/g.35880 Transcript_11764/m.35880 type:complete len:82 (+) Transcript_11764:73-318(+)